MTSQKQLEQRILDRINTMPSLPPTVMKVVSIANDLNASAKDLVSVIKLDPVLTGKVLKLINSSYFGLAQKIDNLNRAIVLLGMNTVKNLALSTAVVTAVGNGGDERIDTEQIWKHSLAVAVASKLIARDAGAEKKRLEEFFIAGLLHDIGIIFLVQYMADEYVDMLEHRASGLGTSLAEEVAQFQMNHTEIGGLIAEKWGLNPNLHDCIRWHHEYKPDVETALELACVHVADIIARRMGFGYPGEPVEDIVSPEAWTTLGISQDQAKAIVAELPDAIERASIFLST